MEGAAQAPRTLKDGVLTITVVLVQLYLQVEAALAPSAPFPLDPWVENQSCPRWM